MQLFCVDTHIKETLLGVALTNKLIASASQSTTVKTALRVIGIIELFAQEMQPLSLSEIARALDVPVSSCLGLLRTLTQLGYLYETGKRQGYYPTGRLYTMAQRIYRADPILEKIRPSLEELRNTTQETIVLGKLNADWRVVYIDVVQSPNPIRYVAVAGTQRSVHANSIGKALLSCLTVAERQTVFKNRPLGVFNPRTLHTIEAIEADLTASHERGYFANFGESIADVAGVAWPLQVNGTFYAVSIVGPMYRIQEHLTAYAERLRSVCRLIEDQDLL